MSKQERLEKVQTRSCREIPTLLGEANHGRLRRPFFQRVASFVRSATGSAWFASGTGFIRLAYCLGFHDYEAHSANRVDVHPCSPIRPVPASTKGLNVDCM